MTDVEPHVFVIFGATGDLTKRKLLPALARLAMKGGLGQRHVLIGVGRGDEMDDGSFRRHCKAALGDFQTGDWCDRAVYFHSVHFDDYDSFVALARRIAELERKHELPGNRVFYLALPPAGFVPAIEGLMAAGLQRSRGYTRLVVEKPIGHDLASAETLIRQTQRAFDETQVYRIDHYLGKAMVQNLLVFRFGNAIFESIWNRKHVESVQITVAESLGLEGRASYYDHAGAMRDMVQNHLAQLLSLIGMEVPAAFDARSIRHEKVKLLQSIRAIGRDDVVWGRYHGYAEEPGVDPDSRTETFVAMRLAIDNWRWQGVPFYVRTGKCMAERATRIAIVFQRPPIYLFESFGSFSMNPNVLQLTLQPNEGFVLTFDVKTPGEPFAVKTVPLDFEYGKAFGEIPEAYETLLLDILTGDQTLFVHAEEALASWRLFDPLLDGTHRLRDYRQGSWGPRESNALLAAQGHGWFSLDEST
jgi:glucose-6-phosphate 1-dehydrogenase